MFQTQFIHPFVAHSAHTVVCQADPDVSPHVVRVSLWLGVGWGRHPACSWSPVSPACTLGLTWAAFHGAASRGQHGPMTGLCELSPGPGMRQGRAGGSTVSPHPHGLRSKELNTRGPP